MKVDNHTNHDRVGFEYDTTANKGEWSEIYVFLRLLGDGRLYVADSRLQRNPNSYAEVLKIPREDTPSAVIEYVRSEDGSMVDIVSDGVCVDTVPAAEFARQADDFVEYLCVADVLRNDEGKKIKGVPVSDELYEFSQRIRVSNFKAPACRTMGVAGGKTDIIICMRDGRSAMTSTMGFSVKSHLASPPTLYNASASTQFEYVVHGMDDEMMDFVNSTKSWKAVSRMYNDNGLDAEFIGTANPVTAENMFWVRESMVDLMAAAYKKVLLESYADDTKMKYISNVCHALAEDNVLNYPSAMMYEKVMKDFLFDAFAGMTGARPWDGFEQINGGYIVVKDGGEVLCYHANDREAFREYLFTQTYIEYVDRSKFKWGEIRKEDGLYILSLNGSVRFNKRFRER